MKIGKAFLLSLAVLLASCSTVTIHPETSEKLVSEPTMEERMPFYWWGLSGEHRINVKQVCGDSIAQQMQSQQTFYDGVFGVITLGIYSPHTVKIWCK